MASPDTHGLNQPTSWEDLDARLARIERYLGLESLDRPQSKSVQSDTLVGQLTDDQQGSDLEASIGEFGLAWIGSIVFFLGVVFLVTYTFSLGHRVVATIVGYSAAAGLYLAAAFWKSRASHLSRILVAGSLLLLFYTTMRLHFFSPTPLIENSYVVLVCLLIVVSFQIYLAVRRDSQSLAGIGVLMGMVAALLIDRTHIELPLVAAFSGVAVYLALRRGWRILLNAAIVLAYASHLVWLLNNPVAGHPVQAVSEHQYHLVYLFLYAAIFSLPALIRGRLAVNDVSSVSTIFLNCFGLGFLMFLAVLTHFQKELPAISLAVFGLLLASSIALWLRSGQQLGPAIYASFGFMALSIAIYGYAPIPGSFLWLSLQSLLGYRSHWVSISRFS